MKYVLITLVIIGVFTRCGHNAAQVLKQVPFKVHAVHNICGNMWAVQISPEYPYQSACYWGKYSFSGTISYNYGNPAIPKYQDSSLEATIPLEYQFSDSMRAMSVYNDFYRRKIRPEKIADSIQARKEHIADSIYECQHTYQ